MKRSILLFALAIGLTTACTNSAKQPTAPSQQPVAESIEVTYHVEGMTCDHCEQSIQKGVAELPGIQSVEANHEDSTTKVIYDPSQTDQKAITQAIEKRGYTVTGRP